MKNSGLYTYKEQLIGFSGEKVHLDGFITLHFTLGTWTVKIDFLVVDYPSAYNIILERPALNKIRAIISIVCMIMKCFIDDREIVTMRADQAIAHKCYNASLEVTKKKKEDKEEVRSPSSSKVMLVDLDARGRQKIKRLMPNGELEVEQIGLKNDQTTQINKNLPISLKEKLVAFLRKNVNLFT